MYIHDSSWLDIESSLSHVHRPQETDVSKNKALSRCTWTRVNRRSMRVQIEELWVDWHVTGVTGERGPSFEPFSISMSTRVKKRRRLTSEEITGRSHRTHGNKVCETEQNHKSPPPSLDRYNKIELTFIFYTNNLTPVKTINLSDIFLDVVAKVLSDPLMCPWLSGPNLLFYTTLNSPLSLN